MEYITIILGLMTTLEALIKKVADFKGYIDALIESNHGLTDEQRFDLRARRLEQEQRYAANLAKAKANLLSGKENGNETSPG